MEVGDQRFDDGGSARLWVVVWVKVCIVGGGGGVNQFAWEVSERCGTTPQLVYGSVNKLQNAWFRQSLLGMKRGAPQ